MGGGGIAQMSDPRKDRKMLLDANYGTKKRAPRSLDQDAQQATALGGLPATVTD
jgi:regulator of extracellular matrix RemA (YlzA/DUF370 family)